MSKSLQDQLLNLGLAKSTSEQTGNKNRQLSNASPGAKSRPTANLNSKSKKETSANSVKRPTRVEQISDADLSLAQAYRLREKQTKELAEHTRALKREDDRKRRQINNSIRLIVEPNRLNDPAAELSRNFMHKGRIRKVNVTAEQLADLNSGALGLVYLAGGYHILNPEHVALVLTLSAEHIPDLSGSADEDDQYPVPDDLVW